MINTQYYNNILEKIQELKLSINNAPKLSKNGKKELTKKILKIVIESKIANNEIIKEILKVIINL